MLVSKKQIFQYFNQTKWDWLGIAILVMIILFTNPAFCYETPLSYDYNVTANRITSTLTAEDGVIIDQVYSHGLIKQKHVITINSPSKNVKIIPRLVSGELKSDFRIFKEVITENSYPIYADVFKGNLTIIDYGTENITELVEGGTDWSEEGTYIITYETPIASEGKIDIEVCLDGDCYLFDPWWDSDYTYRRTITVDMSSLPTDFSLNPILIKLNSSNFDFDHIQSDCDDIRFIDSTDTTEYPYDIEICDTGSEVANFWVKVPNTLSSLRLYYGNDEATSGEDDASTWVGWNIVYNFQNSLEDNSGSDNLQSSSNLAYTTTDCPAGYCITPSGGTLSAWRTSQLTDFSTSDTARYIQVAYYGTATSDRVLTAVEDNAGVTGIGYDSYIGGASAQDKIDSWCYTAEPYIFDAYTSYNAPTSSWEVYMMTYMKHSLYGLSVIHNGTVQSVTDTYTGHGTYNLLDDDSGTPIEIHLPDGKMDFVRIRENYMGFPADVVPRNNVTYQILHNNYELFDIGEEYYEDATVNINEPMNTTYSTTVPDNLNFNVTGSLSSYTCYINYTQVAGINYTDYGSVNNNTSTDFPLVLDLEGSNYVYVNCSGLYNSFSSTLYFTLDSHSTNTENVDEAIEKYPYTYNLTVTPNTGLVNISTIQANFTFNGTTYQATGRSENSTAVVFNRTITMPEITEEYNTTVNVNWDYNFTYFNSTVFDNSTNEESTTIYNPTIDNCTMGSAEAIKLYLKNETDFEAVIGAVDIELTLIDENETYNFDLDEQNNYTLCIYPAWASYQTNADITYSNSSSHEVRNLYWRNRTISNTTYEKDLHMIGLAEGDFLIIEVKDIYAQPIQEILVKMLRRYVDLGETKEVAWTKTNHEGQGSTYAIFRDVEYKFELYNNTTGELLQTTPYTKIESLSTYVTLPITYVGSYITYFEIAGCLTSNYTVTGEDNKTVEVTVQDTCSLLESLTLKCVRKTLTGLDVTIYESTSTGSDEIMLNCELGNTTNNNYIIYASISLPNYDYWVLNEFPLHLNYGSTGFSWGGWGGMFIFLLVVGLGVSFADPKRGALVGVLNLIFALALGVEYVTWGIIIMFLIGLIFLIKRRGSSGY